MVIYQPGTVYFDRTVDDVIQASMTGASDAIAITRTGSYVSDIRIDVVDSTKWSPLSNWDYQSVITATVINNDDQTPISGVKVTFTVQPGGFSGGNGSVSPDWAITDNNGNAVSVYQANNITANTITDVVMVRVEREGYPYTDGVVIQVAPRP